MRGSAVLDDTMPGTRERGSQTACLVEAEPHGDRPEPPLQDGMNRKTVPGRD